jgi:hypothetical protein
MQEYYPGDKVIRTQVGEGMIARIIDIIPEGINSYMVEILKSKSYYADVGAEVCWQSNYFTLLEAAHREPDWEV